MVSAGGSVLRSLSPTWCRVIQIRPRNVGKSLVKWLSVLSDFRKIRWFALNQALQACRAKVYKSLPVQVTPCGEGMTLMISVIILCRNYEQYLQTAVTSVENQTYQNYELLVLHDSCEKTFIKDHPQGEARMRNIAAEQAKGEYLLYLDADDFIEPQTLEKMFREAEQDTVVTCWAQFFGESQNIYKQKDFTPRDFLTENRTHITCLLPKKIWREVGGFDTKCKGWPDWEFWIRVVWKGFKFKVIPETLFHYQIHEGSESKLIRGHRGNEAIDYIKRKHKDKFATL
jgi:glycosyltransferase involved in cell wall biosynthesis